VDIRLRGERSGIDLLRELKRQEPDVVVIVITGFGSIDSVITSMKGGAADYFLSPSTTRSCWTAVRRNLQLRTLARENRFLRDELSCVPAAHLRDARSRRAGAPSTADKVRIPRSRCSYGRAAPARKCSRATSISPACGVTGVHLHQLRRPERNPAALRALRV